MSMYMQWWEIMSVFFVFKHLATPFHSQNITHMFMLYILRSVSFMKSTRINRIHPIKLRCSSYKSGSTSCCPATTYWETVSVVNIYASVYPCRYSGWYCYPRGRLSEIDGYWMWCKVLSRCSVTKRVLCAIVKIQIDPDLGLAERTTFLWDIVISSNLAYHPSSLGVAFSLDNKHPSRNTVWKSPVRADLRARRSFCPALTVAHRRKRFLWMHRVQYGLNFVLNNLYAYISYFVPWTPVAPFGATVEV